MAKKNLDRNDLRSLNRLSLGYLAKDTLIDYEGKPTSFLGEVLLPGQKISF